MQKRLVRKLDLEILLSNITPHPSPDSNLEQYTISTHAAATMLHIATYINNDVIGKRVADLGCGTGRLAIGAAFLGAKHVVGIDIDKNAVKQALKNSVKTCLKDKIEWVAGDIDVLHGNFDTVLQNPPFGVQKRRADRKFLEKALEIGKVVYSLHKHPKMDKALLKKLKSNDIGAVEVASSSFLERFIENHGGKIRAVYAMVMTIPHLFKFHTKMRHEFVADLFVIERK